MSSARRLALSSGNLSNRDTMSLAAISSSPGVETRTANFHG
jgi:hypothetical protein